MLDGLAVNDRQDTFLASMGIYVFNMNVLFVVSRIIRPILGSILFRKQFIRIEYLVTFLRAIGKILVLFDPFGQLIWR